MPTLRDIAERAQVDVSIVSRILHKRDYRRASAATRERIEKTARELGYEPNGLARSLVRQKTDMVALMIPDLYEPAFVRYLETIDELLEAEGMQVLPLLSRWSPEREQRLLRAVRQRRVDGVISLFYQPECRPVYDELRKMGFPLVFRSVDDLEIDGFDQVGTDIADGAQILTRHLWENGFERVALFGGMAAEELAVNQPLTGVAKGYARAHQEAGKMLDPQLGIVCRDDGLDAAQQLHCYFDSHPKGCDGILVQSNSKLPGLYRAFAERGLRIGRDIGVATITDSEFCHLGEVGVTAWEQPIAEICQAMSEAFFGRLAVPDAPPIHRFFGSRLVVRESSKRQTV